MNKRQVITCIATMSVAIFIAMPAAADSFVFSTGNPDCLIGTLSRPTSGGLIQTETADDFILKGCDNQPSNIYGLASIGSILSSIADVEIEIYHVFPTDSANPPSGNVPTRMNSPSDNEIASATRDGTAGSLSFTSTLLNPRFSVANTVVNGINTRSLVNSLAAKDPRPEKRFRSVSFSTNRSFLALITISSVLRCS